MWLDAEVGGLPRPGVAVAVGDPGSGKSTLALGYTLSALKRGRTCFVTMESPLAVMKAATATFEEDLKPYIAHRDLSILSFGPFFVNKARSMQSIDAQLAELGEFVAEREFQCVVFDTFDAALTWIDPTTAKTVAGGIVDRLRSWEVSVLCTASADGGAAVAEFARAADGHLEIGTDRFVIRSAKWCNVHELETPIRFIQGRGFCVAEQSAPRPVRIDSVLPGSRGKGKKPMLELIPNPHRSVSPASGTPLTIPPSGGLAATIPPPSPVVATTPPPTITESGFEPNRGARTLPGPPIVPTFDDPSDVDVAVDNDEDGTADTRRASGERS